jgi:hypothetical protein
MAQPSCSPLRPELLALLADIGADADALAAPSLAHAASHWYDDDDTLADMVRRGVAIDIGAHPKQHKQP